MAVERLVALIFYLGAGATATAGSPFWSDLETGPHRVGFEERLARDYSRPYRSEGADRSRPVAISVWYPANGADGEPVAFRRYVPDDGREKLASWLGIVGFRLTDDALERLLSTPTAAREGAPRAPGVFPLLIFGTGLNAPSYLHTVLCEYLASHGYVVVAIPSLPIREGVSPSYDHWSVDAQLRDMELVIQTMHDYPGADIARIGLVAWSLGGVSQALLQMKNPDVAAVVSLDAATGYDYGWKLLEESMFFQPARATTPYFHATDSRLDTSQARKSFEFYDDVVRGASYLLLIEGANHAEFTSLASVIPHAIVPRDGSSDVMRRYRLLALYVRRFLDAALKDDGAAREFLEVAPSRHGFEGVVLTRKR